jgi:hypothetical protein
MMMQMSGADSVRTAMQRVCTRKMNANARRAASGVALTWTTSSEGASQVRSTRKPKQTNTAAPAALQTNKASQMWLQQVVTALNSEETNPNWKPARYGPVRNDPQNNK